MWISTNERLPKNFSYVLTIAEDGYISTDYIRDSQDLDDWKSGGDPVKYWCYIENPKDMPGLNLHSAYRDFWEMADEHRTREIKEKLKEELVSLADPVSEFCK